MIEMTLAGTSGREAAIGAGSSSRIEDIVCTAESRLNARRPVSISYRIAPSAN